MTLSITVLSAFMISVAFSNVMLSVIMLNVVVLNVVAPVRLLPNEAQLVQATLVTDRERV